ncbi:MAG: hypothetical protein L0216_18085 [Planctomycetales bacterium]|nr:hypothetical protein [Planctomycetales bacterium]
MARDARTKRRRPGRPLSSDEQRQIRALVAAVRTRSAQSFASLDDVDLAAYEDQLAILRVVHENGATSDRHLVLENLHRAARSVPSARLVDSNGRAVTLYEDPDYGLLTEVRFGTVLDSTAEPPTGTAPPGPWVPGEGGAS